jgi:hypothetical protein
LNQQLQLSWTSFAGCGKSVRPWVREWRVMWVSKPIYESLPYFYLFTGIVSLFASMYLNHWHWPTICFVVGTASLVGGLVVLLKRRDYRDYDRRASRARDF